MARAIRARRYRSAFVKGPLPIDQALSIAVQIADGLNHAHQRGVQYRDLKPANVMLSKSNVKLMDFGLAKTVEKAPAADAGGSLQATLTTEGTIAGTLQYMAPEQLEGEQCGERDRGGDEGNASSQP